MFKRICFYHYHVNGDCWSTRLIVQHIIEHTKHLNLEYYYTAPRAIDSHCQDIGISNKNFNILGLHGDIKDNLYINNTIYINVWIGYCNLSTFCCFCLKTLDERYNDLIADINNRTDYNIPLIDTTIKDKYTLYNIIPFNYDFYNIDFLKTYIESKRNTYTKIISLMNIFVTTKIILNHINHNKYIHFISSKYPEYLFVTFVNVDTCNTNVISITNIFNEMDIALPKHYGIQYSFLSTLCDKNILLNTGPGLFCFNNENCNSNNRILLIDTDDYCPACVQTDNVCLDKYELYANYYKYNGNNSHFLQIVEEFITL
jgi:hypothetical protein